ncbi:TFIID and SAGA subunit [Vararia minispora EC-137]|uniref:TFIID and SAGA subunit n=1 Tax=Vararia minispora EC-137 TaxID=1314806 RepID=A0ACB8QPX6_9AGAM|nr:TFIID and SAGA subunit [Vararia minispora EC-137]
MSVATPSASSPEATSPTVPAATASNEPQGAATMDQFVMQYLQSRGHESAAKAVAEAIGAGELPSSTLSVEELLKKIAVFADKSGTSSENTYKEAMKIVQELAASGTTHNIKSVIMNIGPEGAEDVLALNPDDKREGFRELEAWVEGSLDMYRPEFRPILYPVFCHFYLDLVQLGFKDAAQGFFDAFSPSIEAHHSQSFAWLTSIRLPHHVQSDLQAQRLRNEKYIIQISRSGFDLLVGWLTEGVGGEAAGLGDGFSGEQGKRGRAAVMRVINNHLKFIAAPSNVSSSDVSWEESTGLLTSLIPQASKTAPLTNPNAFNARGGELKLGPLPMSEDLRAETEKALREQALGDPSIQLDPNVLRPNLPPNVIAPEVVDLPPHPSTFKTMDIQREVEKVRDARKGIRLDPSSSNIAARLPSICAYTLHDVPEGSPCCAFSPDTSLMAAGFEESYIRLWSLKGEPLNGMKSDFQVKPIRDSSSLGKIRERNGSPTRKLIGHSGPVYSVCFDPMNGSAAPPRYLLSSSVDATARLWSLDTMTNVVAYRGHQNPVWDTDWSPMGIYFATASRDRTARLWSTDRVNSLRIYAGHLSDVDCVKFHPNSLYLATGSSDRTARLWDVQKGSSVRVFIGHQGVVSTLAFSPDGQYLATAGEDLAINLWDLGSGKRIKKMTGHVASIYSLAFSAESSLLVSGGADWTVRCWDVKGAGGLLEKSHTNGMVNGTGSKNHVGERQEKNETGDLLATFPTKRTPIIKAHFTPRNLCLVAGPYQAPGGK